MSYRDDPNDIRERKIKRLLEEIASLSANPIKNQSKIKTINTLLDSLQSEVVDEVVCEENIPKEPKTTFKEEKPQKKKFFKKFFDNIGFWLLISPLIIFTIIPVASLIIGIFFSFDNIVEFLTKIGRGYWFVGLIIVPLAIIAIIQVIRGAFLLGEVDADIFGLNDRKKGWKASLYAVINLLGYMALYILLKQI